MWDLNKGTKSLQSDLRKKASKKRELAKDARAKKRSAGIGLAQHDSAPASLEEIRAAIAELHKLLKAKGTGSVTFTVTERLPGGKVKSFRVDQA